MYDKMDVTVELVLSLIMSFVLGNAVARREPILLRNAVVGVFIFFLSTCLSSLRIAEFICNVTAPLGGVIAIWSLLLVAVSARHQRNAQQFTGEEIRSRRK